MKQLLKIKHWQLFLIFLIPSYFVNSSLKMIIVTEFVLILYSLWIYSVGVLGQLKIAELGLIKLKTTYFTINCTLIPLLWLIIRSFQQFPDYWNGFFLQRSFLIISGLYFLFSLFHITYYTSKTISIFDKKRKVKFHELALTMTGLLLFPIGVWFIQPKINKMAK